MNKLKTGLLAALMATTVLASGVISFADQGDTTKFRSNGVHMGQNAYYMSADYTSPMEALSKLTGLSEQQIYEKRADSTLGKIAYDEGVWEEWSTQMLETKKEMFDDRVEKGYMTQAQADEIYNEMLEHHNEMKENPDFDQMFRNNQGFSGKGLNMGNQRGQGFEKGQGCHGGYNNL